MSRLRGAGDEPPPAYSLQPPSAFPVPQGYLSRPQSFHSPPADTARLPPLPPLPLPRSQLRERNAPLPTLPRLPRLPPGRIPRPSTASPSAPQSPHVGYRVSHSTSTSTSTSTSPPAQKPAQSRPMDPTCSGSTPAPASSRPAARSWLSNPRRQLTVSERAAIRAAEAARLEAEREAAEKVARQRAAEEQARVLAQKEKAKEDTREWVLNILRALLSLDISSEDECRSVLRNCAEVCTRRNIDFAALLQEPVIADRLPVYWAIVKRSGMQERDGADPHALALTLVDFSQPLQSATVMGATNACVTVSDNALFHRLRKRFKGFSPTTDTDTVLLGGSEVEDKIVVEEPRGDPRAFVARFELARFRLRMRVAKRVCVVFIARERMWKITFAADVRDASGIYRAWKIKLRLGEHSPPAPVDAQLVITDNSSEPGEPDICIPFKAEERMLGHEKSECISIVLGRSTTGIDLQGGFALYVDALGVLKARFEARLTRPAPPPAPAPAPAAPAPVPAPAPA